MTPESRPEWHDSASCHGLTELFTMPEWVVRRRRPISPGAHRQITKAKAICSTCPVQRQCDAHYNVQPDFWMITAGKTPDERMLRKAI